MNGMRIALILDDSGKLSSSEDGTCIAKYCNDGRSWREDARIGYNYSSEYSIEEARETVGRMKEYLLDCNAVVGRSIIGLPYQTFNSMGLAVIETLDISPDSLNEVCEMLQEPNGDEQLESPVETDDKGSFFFDLIKAQEARPDISSKVFLRDFLLNKPFYRLDLVCLHVPPWIEDLVRESRIEIIRVKQIDEKTHVTILRGCLVNRKI